MTTIAGNQALHKTLHEAFGYKRFRAGQEEVIQGVLSGIDTLAVMPTGAGKSLCYQLPALHLKGTTVVVSPLIALMKDQVDKLGKAAVAAIEVNSTLTKKEQSTADETIAAGKSEMIFTTPERLSDPAFMNMLRQNRVDLFVIDEAHCISQWGHYFEEAEDFERCGTCDNCVEAPAGTFTSKPRRRRVQAIAEPSVAVFKTGDQVRVPRYGEGRVESASAEQIEVAFPDGKKRRFVGAYVARA